MGLIEQLDRDAFQVMVFVPGQPKGELAESIRDHADAYIELPNDVQYCRRTIAGQKLDVMFYPDLGMEPVTYTLALTRLAPVQVATWGHPETSGIPSVDYFISSEALESEGAEQHYTEKLVRLKNLAVYYHRPQVTQSATRSAFNLPEGATLYGCPQSLYKFHPEFDAILAGVLRGDPKGVLVLLKGNHPEWEQRLIGRFNQTMGDVVNRIRWIDRQDRNGYLALMSLLDVSLDPIHFGGGNTSYEALALGVPVVTLPSGFLRGRLTYAMYQQMAVTDCIAANPQHYVELALRLGTDRAYRNEISEKIRAAGNAIFENPAGVRELENFFAEAVMESRA
jgi:predicted O-linked N-acetylglucosamine transferase (SPINDLY family)